MRINAQLASMPMAMPSSRADHFDTDRADLLQMQDEIVARLANTLGFELLKAETQRSAHSTNPDADDLAMRCNTTVRTAGYFSKEAEAGYRLCQQALDADPNNILALTTLAAKFYLPVMINLSADPQADLKRASANWCRARSPSVRTPRLLIWLRARCSRPRDAGTMAIAEYQRALALDPNAANAVAALGSTYAFLGQYEKAIEFMNKAVRLSPHDPDLFLWYSIKSAAYFALQQYDHAIESARRSIAINPNYANPYGSLASALASTGHFSEARDAGQRYRDLRQHQGGAIHD